MTRTKTLIPSVVRLKRDFGSRVGGVVDASQDVDRILDELKLSSDDMTVTEMAPSYVFSGVRRTLTSPFTRTSGTGLANILWENTVFNDGDDWDPVTDSVKVPVGVTRVVVNAVVQWEANSTGDRDACITIAATLAGLSRIRAAAAGETSHYITSGIVSVTAGQFISVRAGQDSGGDLDVLTGVSYMAVYAFG